MFERLHKIKNFLHLPVDNAEDMPNYMDLPVLSEEGRRFYFS